jgi:hypothetical protein
LNAEAAGSFIKVCVHYTDAAATNFAGGCAAAYPTIVVVDNVIIIVPRTVTQRQASIITSFVDVER